jgi:putative methionine-R-sulfoxide reductase with GAF domain
MPVAERICGAAATRDETVIVNDVCRSLDQERRTSQNQIKFFKQSLGLEVA